MVGAAFEETIRHDGGVDISAEPGVLRDISQEGAGRDGRMETRNQDIIHGVEESTCAHVVHKVEIPLGKADKVVFAYDGGIILIGPVETSEEETFREGLGVQAQGGSYESGRCKDYSLTHLPHRGLRRCEGLRWPI